MADTRTVNVNVIPDWMDYAQLVGTLLAVGLAYVAILHAQKLTDEARVEAAKAAEQARVDAAHERRAEWELSVLGALSAQWELTHSTTHVGGYVRSLIREDAPDDDLPLLRALAQVRPTNLGQAEVEHIPADAHAASEDRWERKDAIESAQRQIVTEEIAAAIARRLQ